MKSGISKTKIKNQLSKKTAPELIETIKEAKKHESWLPLAKLLSGPSRKRISVNLSDINSKTSAGDTVLVPGKVLSVGSITKKIRICSLSISSSALSKLKDSKSEAVTILHEIKSNQKAEGLKIVQ